MQLVAQWLIIYISNKSELTLAKSSFSFSTPLPFNSLSSDLKSLGSSLLTSHQLYHSSCALINTHFVNFFFLSLSIPCSVRKSVVILVAIVSTAAAFTSDRLSSPAGEHIFNVVIYVIYVIYKVRCCCLWSD